MDALLKDNPSPVVVDFGELFDFDEDDYDTSSEPRKKASMWIKDGIYIRPSTNIEQLYKLSPGVYKVGYDPNYGYQCQEITIKTDELYIFEENNTKELLDEINNFWTKKELYKKNNLIHKRGILLEGGPGTSKSSTITLLINQLISNGGIVFLINSVNEFIKYVTFLTEYFRYIEPNTPLITIIEDLDTYNNVEVQLLDFLDGKSNIEHHVIIATTNNSEEISDCILRPSRFDLRIQFNNPSENTRRTFFINKGVKKEDLEQLVNLTDNFSFADLKEIFISIYLLDYTIEDAAEKIKNPLQKRNYKKNLLNKSTIGF